LATGFNTDPLAHSALVRPHKLAVVDLASGERLTYAALDELADRAAGWLRAELGGAERVAFLGRNSIDMLALALGAQRAGAVFVPLNWRLAAPEIAATVADCTPRIVVAQPEFLAAVPGAVPAAAVMAALRQAERIAERPTEDRAVTLLYTSGTTGTPKGVVVTARNAFAASLNFIAVGEVGANTVAFSDLPMFHTIGLIAVARSTLLAGGTLVLADRFQPRRTLAALADRTLGITHYFAVPAMAEMLAADPAFDPAALGGLHAIFLGGAPLPVPLIERFLGFGIPLVNGYGMSEAGTAIHVPIDREAVRHSAGAIGHPAPHIEVRIVRDGVDAADGEVGEIWLRGPSVTPGYWRRPAETEAAFSGGWYRTGDLARREPGGMYRIVDRLKDMYVSGGENVYPAEVEAALLAHPVVADAAVLGVPDARWGETGVAVVALRQDAALDPAALMAHCRERLAGYKCPSRFVVVAAVPRSPAGKILKQDLRRRLSEGELQ
jgi:fatty-acyl-CoA synthase